MRLCHLLGPRMLRYTYRVQHRTFLELVNSRRHRAPYSASRAMSSTPILNAQGQPIKSALKNDDDVTRSPPGGPVRGQSSPAHFGVLCRFSLKLNCARRAPLCLYHLLQYCRVIDHLSSVGGVYMTLRELAAAGQTDPSWHVS